MNAVTVLLQENFRIFYYLGSWNIYYRLMAVYALLTG